MMEFLPVREYEGDNREEKRRETRIEERRKQKNQGPLIWFYYSDLVSFFDEF